MTIYAEPEESKRIAIELRKKGYSYFEIADRVSIPKSTLALWLKGLKLTPLQEDRLRHKRTLASRRGGQKKSEHTKREILALEQSSSRQITKLSKRELWLMGLLLYWRERKSSGLAQDIHKGVSFTSSDPMLIRFFIIWMKRIGKMSDEDFLFDIFLLDANSRKRQNKNIRKMKEEKEACARYWASITKTSPEQFTRYYVQKRMERFSKNIAKINQRKKLSSPPYGILKVRIRSSSMLARQIFGWIQAIRHNLAIVE